MLPIDAAIQSNLRETTTRVLASLTPREERVLRMRFGIGMNTDHTLEEVGQQFCVTRERIRQIEAKALQETQTSEPRVDDKAPQLPRQLGHLSPAGEDAARMRSSSEAVAHQGRARHSGASPESSNHAHLASWPGLTRPSTP